MDSISSFRPIAHKDLADLGELRVLGMFNLVADDQSCNLNMGATDKNLLIFTDNQSMNPCRLFSLSFDCKFETLREMPWINDQTPGKPIGFRIQKQLQNKTFQSFQIYSQDPSQIQQWKKFLQKHINQRNFHALFKAKKQIGRGAFATVYLAQRLEDKKMVAVKAFSKAKQYSGEQGKQSLINQISLLRKFEDPHILKLEGVYETQNSIYVIMQILQGRQLQDRLKNKQINKPEQIQEILYNLLLALKSLSQKNVIHRDLKPQNIMFRKQGSCDLVICDFGLATNANEQKYLFVRCGTPGFVAPQIINIRDMSTKSEPISDVFSAGLIFHYLLFGRSIFQGKKYHQILAENRTCSFNFDKQIYKKLHPSAIDLLKKMLDTNPKTRITAEKAKQHNFFSKKLPNLLNWSQQPFQVVDTNRVLEESEMIDEKDENITYCTTYIKSKKSQYSSNLEPKHQPSLHSKKISFQVGSSTTDKQNCQPMLRFNKKISFGMQPELTLRRSKRNSVNQRRVSYKQNRC